MKLIASNTNKKKKSDITMVHEKLKNRLLTKKEKSDIIIFGHWFFIIKNIILHRDGVSLCCQAGVQWRESCFCFSQLFLFCKKIRGDLDVN